MSRNDADWRRVIAERPPWMSHLLDFHTRPHTYLHPSRLPQKAQRLMAALPGLGARESLDACLAKRFNLKVLEPWTANSPRERLILLPRNELERLVLFCGAVAQRFRLCGLVNREAIADARQRIGTGSFHFALHKAPLLVPQLTTPGLPKLNRFPIEVAVIQSGLWLLASCLHRLSTEIKRRFQLKLPTEWGLPRVALAVEPALQASIWRLFSITIQEEVESSWHPWFF